MGKIEQHLSYHTADVGQHLKQGRIKENEHQAIPRKQRRMQGPSMTLPGSLSVLFCTLPSFFKTSGLLESETWDFIESWMIAREAELS